VGRFWPFGAPKERPGPPQAAGIWVVDQLEVVSDVPKPPANAPPGRLHFHSSSREILGRELLEIILACLLDLTQSTSWARALAVSSLALRLSGPPDWQVSGSD